MKKAFWQSVGGNVALMKAVVSSTGHAIGKNYDPKELRPGDIGISVRADTNGVEELTPAQQTAAVSIAREMGAELIERLGGGETPGFKPGMGVRYQDSNECEATGIAQTVTDSGITVKTLRHDGTWILVHVPYTSGVLEEDPEIRSEEDLTFRTLRNTDSKNTGERARLLAQVSVERLVEEALRAIAESVNHIQPFVVEGLDSPERIGRLCDRLVAEDKCISDLLKLPFGDEAKIEVLRRLDEYEDIADAFINGRIGVKIATCLHPGDRDWTLALLATSMESDNRHRIHDGKRIELITDHVTDDGDLLAIVLDHRYSPECKVRAAKKIKDQATLLAALGLVHDETDGSGEWRRMLNRLTDPGLLADFARNSRWSAGRIAAINRIDDPEVLAGLAMDTDVDVAVAAIVKLPEDTMTVKNLITHPHFKVREAAVRRTRDQKTLARLAKSDPEQEVRQAAVANLEDQKALNAVAVNAQQATDTRVAAAKKLTDPATKKQLIHRELERKQPDWLVAVAAFSDDADFETIWAVGFCQNTNSMCHYNHFWGISKAIDALPPEQLLELTRLPNNGLGDAIMMRAVKRLAELGQDEALVARYREPEGTFTWNLRMEIVKQVNDHSFLVSLLKDRDTVPRYAEIAANRITDQAVLMDMAMNRVDGRGLAAARALTSQFDLYDVAMRTKSDEVAAAAAERIGDPHLLRKISKRKGANNGELGRVLKKKHVLA